MDLHYQSREWSWLQQITLSHAIFRHSLKVSMDHKLFPLNSFYSAVLFWDWESLTVWAQLIRLTSVLEICLVYLSKHSFIHKYLDRCWVHKRHFFCFCSKNSLSWWLKVKELQVSFGPRLIRAVVLFSKIHFEYHFYCVSDRFLCQIKAGLSQIYFRKKISCSHEYIKCQNLSFVMKSAYKIVSGNHT